MSRFAPVFVIIAASLWGIDGIILRPTLFNLPVPLVVFIESIIVALLLSPIIIKQYHKIKTLKLGDWLSFFGVAFFGGVVGTMAITKALFYVNYVNLSIVILIQKLQPVFALLLAAVLLKERLPREFFMWAGFAIFGAYLMTFGVKLPNLDTGEYTILAGTFALLAAASFGSSTVLSKRALKNVSFEMGTYLRFSMSALILLIVVTGLGNFSDVGRITEIQWWIFLLIAFTTGGPAIFLYYYGLKKITASVATICELAFPLTAVILEYFIRGNLLNIVQWMGVFILISSMVKVSGIQLGEEPTQK
ncbi:DMT family transporter [Bacteroidota bacterium]